MAKTIAELKAEVAALITTNSTKDISALKLRTLLNDILDNEQVTASQINTISGTANAANTLFGDGTWKTPISVVQGGDASLIPTRASGMVTSFASVASGGPSFVYAVGFSTVFDTPTAILYKRQSTPPASPFPASGYFQSTDGDYWVIQPQNGEFWVEHFGARGRDNTDRTDQWQFFEDCKYAILLQPDTQGWNSASSEGGTTMRIGRGSFYMTKSHSIEGGAYHVQGCGYHNGGTLIRTNGNVDGFQVQYNFGGQGQTFGHEGGPLNGGARLVGNLCYVPGQTHVYVATNTGSPNLGSPPTGTGPGTITSGSATFLYVRERTWSEQRGIGGDYSKISDLVCAAVWDPAINGYDEDQTAVDGGYHCGILMRARAAAENVSCQSYAGHGICIAGDGGSECRGGGVPNNAIVRNYRGYFNAHDGLRIEGTDANACLAEIIDTGFNKRSGVTDESLLGNRYVHLQSAFDGLPGNTFALRYGACTYLGYYYMAQPKQLGSFRTVNYTLTPGAVGSEFSWNRISGNGASAANTNYPTWTNALFFQAAGPFISNNINAESQILGLYTEGSAGGYPPQLGLFDVAWGSALGNGFAPLSGATAYSRSSWLNRVTQQTEFDFDDGPRTMKSFLGGQAVNAGKASQAVDNTVWGYQDFESNTVRMHFEAPGGVRAYANADVYIRNDASPNFIMGWTGFNTSRHFGQTALQREVVYFPQIVLGSAGTDMTDTGATLISMTKTSLGAGAVAATGEKNGRIYFYANPGPGDPVGWQVQNGFYRPFP